MSPAKKSVLENPPRAPKLKSLAAIYAAEDAIKAACNSPFKSPEKSSPAASDTESEPLNYDDEEISSSLSSEENDLSSCELGAFDEVSLKDLKARCKVTKKRKADCQPNKADGLNEPLIILKAKKLKSCYALRSKKTETEVISGCSDVCSKCLVEEVSPGIQETLTMQPNFSATSSSHDISSFYQNCEPLMEVDPIDYVPHKVDFIAKFDSCNLSSNLIWQTDANIQSPDNLMVSLNKQCAEIVESEVDAHAHPVCFINDPNNNNSKMITCSLNQACIDSQFEEDLWLLENNSQGRLNLDQNIEVDTDININPVTITETLPTDVSLNEVEYGENLYSSENTHNSPLQSENIQSGNDIIPFCDEACPCDVKPDGDLYSPDGSEVTEAQSDVNEMITAEVTEAQSESDVNETITAEVTEAQSDVNAMITAEVTEAQSDVNEMITAEVTEAQSDVNEMMETGTSAVVAVENIETGNERRNDYEIVSGVPEIFDTTKFRSSEGQLESIVYSAISTSTSVHRVLVSQTDNSETDGDYQHKDVISFGEVIEGSNEIQYTEDNGKEIGEIFDDGAKLEEGKCDHTTTRMHAPKKLMSNRTIISPTSQEKLCQAITDINLCEAAQIPKSKKRILFSGMKKRVMTTKNTEKSPLNADNMIRKGNIIKSTAKMDTEKAIEFSRRQMHDFENVTTKLLKNMRFMRSLLDESLALQSPWISKFSADEMKAASENASELERTTKKWLALMSKDCNRFCKILKLASNNASPPPTSNNGVANRRKIVFADEAGGILCDVRVFSEGISPTKAENES